MSAKKEEWSIRGRMEALLEKSAAAYVPEPPFPHNMMIELSNACNHKCVFCANPKMTRRRRLIDRELLLSILAQGRELGAREVGFYTTGDPFVHVELATFVREAKQLGYEYVYISTNGALAVPKRSRAVIDAGLDSMKFSINAGSRESYLAIHGRDDWDKVLENLRFVAAYRKELTRAFKLGITYVVIDQNRHEREAFRAEFAELVDDLCFYEVDNQQGYMPENQSFIATESTATPMRAPCYMVFSRAHVTCEGYLTLCCVDYQNYLAVADLKVMSLREAWTVPEFVSMRKRHLENRLDGTLCFNCIEKQQSEVEPLVEAFATKMDLTEGAQQNLERQRRRLKTLPVE